ncbi:helix-turn-helix transcriptional regulator [Qipengyuania sp. DGS5-3]|uniref:helix-turn-helix transcriptional regulator n=1 Tax=Qipengyuania sp. DGS5-3 TaxID=3349632 RepID=UPI0036D3D91E
MASTGGDAEIWRKGMAPVSGTSSAGAPLSENRQPAEDLRPWVARLVAAKIHLPPGTKMECGMCNDLVYVRAIFNAKWSAETLDGHGEYEREALLFGQHSKFMPLTCEGDIMSAGFGLRAGAFHALFGRSAHDIVDRIEQNDLFGLMGPDFRDTLTDQHTPEEWNLAMEEAIRRVIAKLDPEPPNKISTDFEVAAFADPSLVLADFAEEYGISLRKLERLVKRDFGMPPKKVLRRARALDFAAQLCGVADDEEEEEMILRYFDQSHMIREFAKFFGFTPREFRSVPRPLLTITLEQRQARRLEELERLPEGAQRPWQAD